jgi:hypothetical protein
MTSKTQKVGGQPTGKKTEYTWDHRNRLVKVLEKPSPSSSQILKIMDQI